MREEIKHGADWIKLAATGGVMSAADDPRAQAFTDEELRAAVDEAHRHGRKVTVHAIGTGGIKASLRAGVDGIEHGLLIDAEAIAMMKERGVPLVPTIYVLDYIIEQGEETGIPADRIAKARSLQADRDRAMRAAFTSGPVGRQEYDLKLYNGTTLGVASGTGPITLGNNIALDCNSSTDVVNAS